MWYLTLLQSGAPTGPIPYTGYLICFAPLALTIIGFITAAMVTDRHARRSYLRFAPGDSAPPRMDATKVPTDVPLPSDTQMVNR